MLLMTNFLESIVIPDSVISIGNDAFANNDLTSIAISNSVTSIGSHTFINNRLTSIVIPTSVTSIGVGAFDENDATLNEVCIESASTDITLGANAFGDVTPTYESDEDCSS